MSDKQLQSMTEQEIRARFRCAPAYYLQAKLERKRALEGRTRRSRKAAPSGRQVEPGAAVQPTPTPAETMSAPRAPARPAPERRPSPPTRCRTISCPTPTSIP